MPAASFVWALLQDEEFQLLKKLAPRDFNWRALHPELGIPALSVAIIHNLTRVGTTSLFDIVAWLLERGADPAQETPRTTRVSQEFWITGDGGQVTTLIKVNHGGKSIIEFLIEIVQLFKTDMKEKGKAKADWSTSITKATQLLNMLADACATTVEKDTLSVGASVVHFWERIYGASCTHDLTFETADGKITAHCLVLAQASSVLSAMLSSSMREGCEKKIDVKDASSKGVSFFLDLLYTGSSCSDVGFKEALVALDLSHRWQVGHVVTMVTGALEGMLTDESFTAISESAALKGLNDLIKSCKSFGDKSKSVQKLLKEGALPQAVLDIWGMPSKCHEVPSKKRRMF